MTGHSDLELHVATTADSKGLKQAADDLDDTKRSSDKLGGSFKETGKESEKLGDSLHHTGDESGYVDRRIKELEGHIKELGREFDRTGDKDVFRSIRKDRGELGNLRRIRGEIEDLADGAKTAATEVTRVGAGLLSFDSPGLLQFGVALSPILAPAVAVVASAIGGAIAGAVVGTTTGAGMLGGILAASKDSRVRAAARDFGDTISAEFFGGPGSAAFVDPIIKSLGILKADFTSLHLDEAFAKAAPSLETLAHGIGDMAKNFMPGFNKALDKSGVFTDIFAHGLADTGDALGDMLTSMTESEGATEGLRGLFVLLNGTLREGGDVIGWLSDRFHDYVGFADWATGILQHSWAGQITSLGHMDDWHKNMHNIAGGDTVNRLTRFNRSVVELILRLKEAGLHASTAAGGFDSMGTAADLATQATGRLKAGLSVLHREFLDAKDAAINEEQAIDDLARSFDENGKSLDVHTDKGRNNLRALEDVARGAADAAQKTYDQTHSVEKANAVYETYREELYDTLIAAGKTRAEAKKLVDTWLGMPATVTTNVVTNLITRKLTGEEAREALSAGAHHRASGGPVMAGIPYTVGERGTETFVPSTNGTILPHGAGMTGRPSARPLNVTISGDIFTAQLMDALIRALRNQIQAQGGTLAVLGIRGS